MTRTLARIDVPTLAEFLALPDPAAAFRDALRIDDLDDPADPWAAARLGNAWHGTHYFLTGQAYGGAWPLSLAVGIGVKAGHELFPLDSRYLPASDAKAIAEALAALNDDDLVRRFDPARMRSLELYKFGRGDAANDLALLLELFHELQAFYADVARRGAGVVQWSA